MRSSNILNGVVSWIICERKQRFFIIFVVLKTQVLPLHLVILLEIWYQSPSFLITQLRFGGG